MRGWIRVFVAVDQTLNDGVDVDVDVDVDDESCRLEAGKALRSPSEVPQSIQDARLSLRSS